MPGLFANVVFTFKAVPYTQVKGLSVYRRCDPKYSAADVSNRITFQAAKNCVDILVVKLLDPSILALLQGASGALSLTAKTADSAADLVITGTAMVLQIEGGVEFAEVETLNSITFSIISTNGTSTGMSVTGGV
jgi:hypothetical protein